MRRAVDVKLHGFLEVNCNYISFERINWQIDTNSSSKRIYHDTRSQNVNVSSLNLTILAQNSRYDTIFTIAFSKNFFDSSICFDCDIIFQAELFQVLTKLMNIAT